MKYGLAWSPTESPLEIEFKFIRAGGYITITGKRFGLGLLEHYLAARRLVWPERYEHRWTRLMYEEIIRNTITILMGAASCVAGHTKLLNPITGELTPIDDLERKKIRPVVMTLEGARLAHVPFIKGRALLFEVVLENGARFTATGDHRALSDSGFVHVRDLTCGQRLLSYADTRKASISDSDQSIQLSDAARWWRTTQGSQGGCQNDYRFDGERLLPTPKTFPGAPPLPTCARTHLACASPSLDGSGREYARNPSGLSYGHPSNYNELLLACSGGISSKLRVFSETFRRASGSFSLPALLLKATSLVQPSAGQIPDSPHSSILYEKPCADYRVRPIRITSIKSVGEGLFYDLEVPGPRHYFAEGTIHHNTQKTSHASEWVLLDYWCFPNNTLALVTTTNTDKLETNVFGEIKALWGYGKSRFPWLAGHVVDHKHSIFTDDIDSLVVRDRRRGIIGKACFCDGTMVDTPSGPVAIETVQVGDEVVNAAGVGRVLAHSVTRVRKLVRIYLENGKRIDCTPDHPFLTQRGWVKAVDVGRSHKLISSRETLRILQEADAQRARQQKILLSCMSGVESAETVQAMRRWVLSEEVSRRQDTFLFHVLFSEMEHGSTSECGQDAREPEYLADGQSAESFDSRESKRAQAKSSHDAYHQRDSGPRRENQRGGATVQDVPRGETQLPSWEASRAQGEGRENNSSDQPYIPRPGLAQRATGRGIRWALPSTFQGAIEGPDSRAQIDRQRVVRVEILESSGDSRYSEREGGYRVHNFTVSGHPSYSVNGAIVHNCYEGKQWVGDAVFVGIKQDRVRFIGDELQWMAGTFLRSWNPLFSNPDLKVIGSGNPNHNPDDPLGIAAEPKEGWASLKEPDKTEVWDTKYLEGRCVNLVGTDSPNFDVPDGQPEPFPRLIGRKFMRRIVHDSGPDSPDFYRLVKGVMKFSLAHTRVINRQLCRDHHAHDKALWGDVKRTKIYAIDPAYGGGDRCVAGYAEFGKDLDGKQILCVRPPWVVQINLKLAESPEDQIASAAYNDMAKYSIPNGNAFYGAFGKGTIGFAFARKFGADSPVPIEEGGRPSKRPVRQDLRLWDEVKRELRHKRCDEHYSKKITELWFSTRYAIEAEQIRELPENVMEEGCAREYSTVAGNLIEVESKEDMKERLSRSPDLYDWFSFIIEGARQRGFLIAELGPADEEDGGGEDWLGDKVQKHLALVRSKRVMVKP